MDSSGVFEFGSFENMDCHNTDTPVYKLRTQERIECPQYTYNVFDETESISQEKY